MADSLITNDYHKKKKAAIEKIIGAPLTSVQFVMDYLILGFEPKGALTTLVWPEVIDRNGAITFGKLGYRDRLCDLITHVIRRAEIDDNDTILLRFDPTEELRIPLKSQDAPGERAVLTGPEHFLFVF